MERSQGKMLYQEALARSVGSTQDLLEVNGRYIPDSYARFRWGHDKGPHHQMRPVLERPWMLYHSVR